MTRCYSSINLAGYERLKDLERQIWYSPVAIVLSVIGFVAAGYAFWGLSRGFPMTPQHTFIGYAVVLGAYGCLIAYYHVYRFRRVRCPCCDRIMQPYVTDLGDEPDFSILRQVNIGGRAYRHPYDEDDHRPWVRLMLHVRACTKCKTFVNCCRLHLETCTDEELAVIRQRVGA